MTIPWLDEKMPPGCLSRHQRKMPKLGWNNSRAGSLDLYALSAGPSTLARASAQPFCSDTGGFSAPKIDTKATGPAIMLRQPEVILNCPVRSLPTISHYRHGERKRRIKPRLTMFWLSLQPACVG
jgi:hypothetical protein